MKKEDLYNLETYNYSLPKELIAQYPIEKRDESRLLCYNKTKNKIDHCIFRDIVNNLSENDVLVLNNTKVIPARFYAENDKGKKIEMLLVSPISPDNLTWKILASPKKHLKGIDFVIARSPERATKQSHKSDMESEIASSGKALLAMTTIEVIDTETIRFHSHKDLEYVLNKIGQMPLPPYIKRKSENIDFNRYQTIFAKEPGAVAAPTAALHFTEELLEKLKQKGVEIYYITLHVGPGTFLPIRTDDIREHKLIPESFYIEQEVWNNIQKAKKNKKRIIACGTTTLRALEYAARINKFSGLTGLYVMPGFEFKVVDALITNFHLPKTTLLVLVSSFVGWENVKKIYEEAIKGRYRFYSYGDGMFIE